MALVFELWDTKTNNLIASYERVEDARAQVDQACREQAANAGDLAIFAFDPSTGRGQYLDLNRPAIRAS